MSGGFEPVDRLIGRSVRFLALVAGATLLCLMLITVYSVVMRYLFNAPVPWALDYARVGLVIVTFSGLAYCGWTGGHIAVDLLGVIAPPGVVRMSDVLVRLGCAGLIALMGWQGLRQGFDALEMGYGTNEVGIPVFPFFMVIAFGCCAYVVVLVLQAVRAARGVSMNDPAD